MTELHNKRYLSDTTPGLFSRLMEKTAGLHGISNLKATALVCAVTATPGIFIAILALSPLIMFPCLFIVVGSVLSAFWLASTSRTAWMLFVSVLSLSLVYSVLLFFIFGFRLFGLPVFLFYLATLVHVLRPSIRAEFSVSTAMAYTTALVPMIAWTAVIIIQ